MEKRLISQWIPMHKKWKVGVKINIYSFLSITDLQSFVIMHTAYYIQPSDIKILTV